MGLGHSLESSAVPCLLPGELGVQVEGSVDTLLSRVFETLGILALAIGTPTGL